MNYIIFTSGMFSKGAPVALASA